MQFLDNFLPPFLFPPRGKGFDSFPSGGRLGRGLMNNMKNENPPIIRFRKLLHKL
jgi:hypothetical protein